MEVKMKMFVLQNRDYSELFWSSELGWADIDHADFFQSSELEESHAIELQKKTNGKWVLDSVTVSYD